MFLTALTYYQSALFIIWSLFSNWYSSWRYSVLSLVSNFIFVRHNCNNGFVTTSNIDFWWSTNKDISSFQFHSQGHNREQTRLGLQCQTPLRSYPLTFDTWPLSLIHYPLSLIPYPLSLIPYPLSLIPYP